MPIHDKAYAKVIFCPYPHIDVTENCRNLIFLQLPKNYRKLENTTEELLALVRHPCDL